jgi:hypothetical protein
MPQIITTSQAPNAKPTNKFLILTTNWVTMITVDEYDVPKPGFGVARRIAPGVVEITSPLTLSNVSSQTQLVSVRIVNTAGTFVIANQIPVEPNDIVYIPLNGQFLLSDTDDTFQIKAEAANNVTAMISYTQGQAEENDPLGN